MATLEGELNETAPAKEYPFDALDLLLLLLAPMHPLLIVLALIQYWARRSPMVSAAVLELSGVPISGPGSRYTEALLPGVRKLLPAPAVFEEQQFVDEIPSPALLPARAALRLLAPAVWLALVNDRPDDIPHLAIYGPSGSGKTRLCQGILYARGGQYAVIDPKPAMRGQIKWGGIPYARIDPDGSYRSIESMLRALRTEVNARLVALDRGGEAVPLTVVLDEYKLLARECKDSAPDLYIKLSDIGRELRMRLIVLSTTRGVRGLGIEGLGDTRDNFITIELDRQHRATLEWDGATYLLDTAPVIALGQRAIPAARWWQPPQAVQSDARDLLAGLLAQIPEPVPASSRPLSGLSPDREPVPQLAVLPHTTAVLAGTDRQMAMIQSLLAANYSANDIAALLGGNRAAALAKIRAAKAAGD
jgi:hypothetical protein